MNTNAYPSAELLLSYEKEEYDYQRERLEKVESKIGLIVTLIGAIASYEIANMFKVLDINFEINSLESFCKFINIACNNFPYCISVIFLLYSAIQLLVIIVNAKCKVVNVVKLYNDKVYSKEKEDSIPYLMAIYAKCNAYNFRIINKMYKRVNFSVILLIISLILFGIAYLI